MAAGFAPLRWMVLLALMWLHTGCVGVGAAQASATPPASGATAAGRSLKPFADAAELRAYVEPLVTAWREQEAARERQVAAMAAECRAWEAANPGLRCVDRPRSSAPLMSAAPAAAPAPAAPAAASPTAESITNNQVPGVDEGGIVKVHGQHLVVLRRGRLFSIDLGAPDARDGPGTALRLADAVPAYAVGGALPVGGWYDEMLIEGDTIVVVGYSWRRGGTEIGLFDIDSRGRITHRATHIMRSADYYASRNYASRLIGRELVLYAPVPLRISADPLSALPSLGPWREGADTPAATIIAPTRIFRTDEALDPRQGVTLHAVVRCDLGQRPLACEATGVLGPSGRVFHVSATAVYVWTVQAGRGDVAARSAVFRLPLDKRALPGAIKTEGSPIDPMSFAEDVDGGLSVLLRANGRGEAMWRAEGPGGNLALLQLKRDDFGDGQARAPAAAYRPLPPVADGALHNRHIGPWLVYGATQRQVRPQGPAGTTAFANRYAVAVETGRSASGRPPAAQLLDIGHSVDRIEALGPHALIVGSAEGDLHFTPLRLATGASVQVDRPWVQRAAAQAESRSHGFFFRQDRAGPQGVDGMAGLPIRLAAPRPVPSAMPGLPQWREAPGAMVWLRVGSGAGGITLEPVGQVRALDMPASSVPGGGAPDGCVASCVDWYGNARPIFLRGRVLALMGYELVEVDLAQVQAGGTAIAERQRLDFMPRR